MLKIYCRLTFVSFLQVFAQKRRKKVKTLKLTRTALRAEKENKQALVPILLFVPIWSRAVPAPNRIVPFGLNYKTGIEDGALILIKSLGFIHEKFK